MLNQNRKSSHQHIKVDHYLQTVSSLPKLQNNLKKSHNYRNQLHKNKDPTFSPLPQATLSIKSLSQQYLAPIFSTTRLLALHNNLKFLFLVAWGTKLQNLLFLVAILKRHQNLLFLAHLANKQQNLPSLPHLLNSQPNPPYSPLLLNNPLNLHYLVI